MPRQYSPAPVGIPGEEYELSTAHEPSSSSSPLLPSYSSHIDLESPPSSPLSKPALPTSSSSSSSSIPKRNSSLNNAHTETLKARKKSRFWRTLLCCWAILAPLLLGFALFGALYGRHTLESLRGTSAWDKVPQEVKDWLDGAVPYEQEVANTGAFPTNIGYPGPTATGIEPGLLVTAPHPPQHTGISPLLPPSSAHSSSSSSKGKKPIHHLWGNLSPYHSTSHGLDSTSLIPSQCTLEGLHWLQRHGARYPTSYGAGPKDLAKDLKSKMGWKGKGSLEFLNKWEYALGSEVLTPFGREQLYDLGVAARVKYGFLLDKMKGRLPVFRTESQDRMLKSAQNFAAGFFGIPVENQYNLEVTIESEGFNNTLAPWTTCNKENVTMDELWKGLKQWDEIFLKDAKKRLQKDLSGYELTTLNLKEMMDMCAYETVALGFSSFCELFTRKEFEGYEYRGDLYWWYSSSFGYPLAKAQGMGWAQELVSRLTHTRITEFNSTTNSSFHNAVQFPLHDSLYVDFTHDTEFALLFPTLNLTSFSEEGPLPFDHIPKHRSFISSELVPFATNLQVQVLSCSPPAVEMGRSADGRLTEVRDGELKVRLILNDGVVPLSGIQGCGENEDGLCGLEEFVLGLKKNLEGVDYAKECGGIRKQQASRVSVL